MVIKVFYLSTFTLSKVVSKIHVQTYRWQCVSHSTSHLLTIWFLSNLMALFVNNYAKMVSPGIILQQFDFQGKIIYKNRLPHEWGEKVQTRNSIDAQKHQANGNALNLMSQYNIYNINVYFLGFAKPTNDNFDAVRPQSIERTRFVLCMGNVSISPRHLNETGFSTRKTFFFSMQLLNPAKY